MFKIRWEDTLYKFGCEQLGKFVADDESTNDEPVIWNISFFFFSFLYFKSHIFLKNVIKILIKIIYIYLYLLY